MGKTCLACYSAATYSSSWIDDDVHDCPIRSSQCGWISKIAVIFGCSCASWPRGTRCRNLHRHSERERHSFGGRCFRLGARTDRAGCRWSAAALTSPNPRAAVPRHPHFPPVARRPRPPGQHPEPIDARCRLWTGKFGLKWRLNPAVARSGRNQRFCLNTPTIAYPRISAHIRAYRAQSAANRKRRKATCHAGFIRMPSNRRRKSHPGGRRFESA